MFWSGWWRRTAGLRRRSCSRAWKCSLAGVSTYRGTLLLEMDLETPS